MENRKELPKWFIVGLRFRSKWINDGDNQCILLSFNETTNLAEVEIHTPASVWTEDGWNLEHTLWGFEQGEYVRLMVGMYQQLMEAAEKRGVPTEKEIEDFLRKDIDENYIDSFGCNKTEFDAAIKRLNNSPIRDQFFITPKDEIDQILGMQKDNAEAIARAFEMAKPSFDASHAKPATPMIFGTGGDMGSSAAIQRAMLDSVGMPHVFEHQRMIGKQTAIEQMQMLGRTKRKPKIKPFAPLSRRRTVKDISQGKLLKHVLRSFTNNGRVLVFDIGALPKLPVEDFVKQWQKHERMMGIGLVTSVKSKPTMVYIGPRENLNRSRQFRKYVINHKKRHQPIAFRKCKKHSYFSTWDPEKHICCKCSKLKYVNPYLPENCIDW